MSKAILYDYWRSSAAYRVRIALNLKGVDYESLQVDLREGAQLREDYRALNPQRLVPMLEIDGHRLTQSLAIIGYLDQRFPTPLLVPSDPADAAHVRSMALAIACDIHPINNLRVLNYLSDRFDASEEARAEWYCHWIADGFGALEELAGPTAGKFLFGDTPTIADVCLVPQVYNARHRANMSLDDYPTLVRADANACNIGAFAAAAPERQQVDA